MRHSPHARRKSQVGSATKPQNQRPSTSDSVQCMASPVGAQNGACAEAKASASSFHGNHGASPSWQRLQRRLLYSCHPHDNLAAGTGAPTVFIRPQVAENVKNCIATVMVQNSPNPLAPLGGPLTPRGGVRP